MDCKPVLLLLLLLFIDPTSARQNISPPARRKAIKNMHGDVYDCVQTYKQPAFNSVKFATHRIQAKPSGEVYKRMGLDPLDEKQLDPHHFGFEEWCPLGYVPIQRIAYNHSRSIPKDPNNHSLSQLDTVYAGIKTRFSDTNAYHGADGYIASYEPLVFGDHQYSSSVISMIGGQSENTKIIAGWTVDPDLNRDAHARVVVGWTNDNFQSIGCYNLLCPGLVLTGNTNPIGSVISPISTWYVEVDKRFTIVQDHTDLKWWLFIDSSPIGYWPHWLFTASLQNGANTIFWGGIVHFIPGEDTPRMGSGRKRMASERGCYMRNVLFSESQFEWKSPDNSALDVLQSLCYHVEENNYRNDGSGYFFNFGGRGQC